LVEAVVWPRYRKQGLNADEHGFRGCLQIGNWLGAVSATEQHETVMAGIVQAIHDFRDINRLD
jgi:hypothetical protein